MNTTTGKEMNYCFRAKKRVYGCDHYQCSVGAKNHYGTGMRYCHIAKRDVYSCGHYKCNKNI